MLVVWATGRSSEVCGSARAARSYSKYNTGAAERRNLWTVDDAEELSEVGANAACIKKKGRGGEGELQSKQERKKCGG